MAEISSNLKCGEIIIVEVPRVLRYSTKDLASGEYGVLCVTNFRITFIPAEHAKVLTPIPIRPSRENRCTPLTSVHKLYAAVRAPGAVFGRQKVALTKSTKVSNIEYIEIETKDFYVHRFGTQFADNADAESPHKGGHVTMQDSPMKKLVATLLQHCFPTSQSYLFALDFTPTPSSSLAPSYLMTAQKGINVPDDTSDCPSDLLRIARQHELMKEIERCGISKDERWYISQNLQFKICEEYPALVVVPIDVQDEEVVMAAPNFQGNRFPIWCWSNAHTGTWVARSAQWTGPAADDSVFMHALSRQGAPVVIGTSKIFAASRVHDSFERLLAACHYERGEHDKLLEKEASWMSTYDETRWPELVQAGVSLASEAVDGLRAGSNVVIEGKASCHGESLVASLAQIVMDPYFRTKAGFDLLIRKEWIATGFPFMDIHATKQRQSPLFLVFLDGVHQMMRQNPTAFEFSDTYLCVLWHAVLSGLWGDFVFNSDKDRTSPAYASTASYWNFNGPAFDSVDDPCVNIMYTYDPEPLQIAAQGWEMAIWGGCLLPQTLGVADAGQHAIRQQMIEKLTTTGTHLRRRLELLAALGREDVATVETYILDHHIPPHLATLLRRECGHDNVVGQHMTVV